MMYTSCILLNYTSSSGSQPLSRRDSIQRARNFGNVCDSTIMLMLMMMMMIIRKVAWKKRLSSLGVRGIIICEMMDIVLYSE